MESHINLKQIQSELLKIDENMVYDLDDLKAMAWLIGEHDGISIKTSFPE